MSMATVAILASLLVTPLLALAADHGHPDHGAHQHGAANLEVAVDGGVLSIRLESPLANLVGFEHAPRSASQRAAASAALATLKQGDRLFAPTPAAACKLTRANVEAPVLEGAKASAGEHGDLTAEYRFACGQPGRLTGVDARLFEAFPGLGRIAAAVVTAKGQQAFRLTRKLHYMNW